MMRSAHGVLMSDVPATAAANMTGCDVRAERGAGHHRLGRDDDEGIADMDPFVVARNPDPDTRSRNLLRLPIEV
jgi:hypothetical protein